MIDWTVCDLVSQRGQTARRHQLRARYRRAQGQRPGQLKWGECGDLRCLLPARLHKPLPRLSRCASSCSCWLSALCWCLQTFVNDVRIQEQSYVTLKIEDKLRFGYDILWPCPPGPTCQDASSAHVQPLCNQTLRTSRVLKPLAL